MILPTGGVLEPLEPWRADEFAAHLDRAREHIRPWVGPSFVSTDLGGARATLARYAESTARDGARIWGIWSEGTLIGGVMFVEFSAGTGVCEIGCWSEPAGEGHGHVGAAVRELLRYAFDVRGLHRAEWRCRSDNVRSIALAERVGMTFEGRLREAWQVAGVFHDKAVYSILDREFS
ncbi:GNAT family protein [Galbitalea sp. SE-J8]|uniref:GNAT family N-acetyltransferase n=1 Tax=Galbitalea sp. SE-J8 TaxID=3054952 RepID=UPI00259D0A50|nr:GNAT family protein [Galbitalea sp. SE-J8]MDM4762440.1 GNAT family protein [Galbitalea sp. SE-J8]